MNAKNLLFLLILVAAGFGIWYGALRPDETDEGAPTPPAATDQAAEADEPEADPEEPALRTADASLFVEPDNVPEDERVRLPDGKWVRALNGVSDPAPFDWPDDRPWSPIVKQITDHSGQQWYVHADGSHSTMGMIWRPDLGREDSYTQIANPEQVQQHLDERLPTRPDPKPRRGR